MKIIVADDEIWVRTALINSIPFEQLGMNLVCEASNGIEALELCRKHSPDILITDIMMPGLTGLELIQQLKNEMPELKIVIISGYSDFEYAKTAIRFGVVDYILKPVDEKEIFQVLMNIKDSILNRKKEIEAKSRIEAQYHKAMEVIHESLLNRHKQSNQSSIQESAIEKAKRFILENYHNDLGIEQVARFVHMNTTYFSELFKKQVGMSFIDFKIFLRLESAKKLLVSTDMNIDEISSKVGYNDPRYFCKLFKRVTGKTAKQYRKENLQREQLPPL